MSPTRFMQLCLVAALAVCGCFQSANATIIDDVTSIRITSLPAAGGFYYVEEYTIPNAAGADVASVSFGSTASANFTPGFSSSINGGIDDATGNCCGTGTHSPSPAGSGQQYSINLPSVQSFNLNNGSTTMRVDDRQDSTCCTTRPFNFNMALLTAGGSVAAERSFSTSDFALTGTGSTGGPRFGEVALDGFAVNIAGSAQAIGASSAINNPNVIGDGNVSDTVAASMFITNLAGVPQGFGYDLGGTNTVDTIRLYQHADAIGGSGSARRRLESVNVHTSQGTFNFTGLANQNVIELDLGGIETSFVLIDPVGQHAGAPDQQLGIREVEVFSSSPVIAKTPNVALGKTVTLEGTNFGPGSAAQLTDGVTTWGPGLDNAGTAVFNNGFSATNGSWVIDLEAIELIDHVSLLQQTFGGGGARNMIENLELSFSNDNFATTLDTINFTLEDGVIYQQLTFDRISAQYVRFNPTSQYSQGSDRRIGIVESQVFGVIVPEPTTMMLGLLGTLGLARRRRRAA